MGRERFKVQQEISGGHNSPCADIHWLSFSWRTAWLFLLHLWSLFREQVNVTSIVQRCKESCVKSVVWIKMVWGAGPTVSHVFEIYGWKNTMDGVKGWRCESCQLCMNVCWKTQGNIFFHSLFSSYLKYQAMWGVPSQSNSLEDKYSSCMENPGRFLLSILCLWKMPYGSFGKSKRCTQYVVNSGINHLFLVI